MQCFNNVLDHANESDNLTCAIIIFLTFIEQSEDYRGISISHFIYIALVLFLRANRGHVFITKKTKDK